MQARYLYLLGAVLSSLFSCPLSTLQAQNTLFTYQGRVTDDGTNFTGTGLFKFALVTGTNTSQQATAVANPPSGGFITIINVTFGGSGYLAAPAVSITGGGGSNATATAQINASGVVTNITVTNPGSGYTSTPAITVAAPSPDILFTTWWSNDGTSVNGSEPSAPVSLGVANGLFTVVLGDTTLSNMTAIPASLFTQPDLQLRIWFNDGASGSVALSPVQNLTPTPYAVVATFASNLLGTLTTGNLPANAAFSGTVTANSFTGNGSGVTNVNAATLGGLGPNSFWQTTGNLGTTAGPNFVGTADNQPLELHVAGLRVLRLEPDPRAGFNSGNLIGGDPSNVILQPQSGGDVIAGGGFAGGGNVVASNSSGIFIGAGSLNQVGPNVDDSVIAGGFGNTNQAYDAVIAGGQFNTIQQSADHSAIGGGGRNLIVGSATVSVYDTIAGGYQNTIQTNTSYVFIGGGQGNLVQPNCTWSFIGGGSSNIVDNGAGVATIGGGGAPGYPNHISSTLGTIGGGSGNTIQNFANDSTIAGGRQNEIDFGAWGAFIGGGHSNWIQTVTTFTSGGAPGNPSYSVIAGGYGNTVQNDAVNGVIAGGLLNVIGVNSSASTIGGGYDNTIQTNANDCVIAGGELNTIGTNSSWSTVGGGYQNQVGTAAPVFVLISPGQVNGIAAGAGNSIGQGAAGSFIGGGQDNVIQSNVLRGTIAGGFDNSISSSLSSTLNEATIGGGFSNTVSGAWATVPGGTQNTAAGAYSFAAGNRAKANADGAFVWADSQAADFSSAGANSFAVRAKGGVFFTSGNTGGTDQNVSWVPGNGAWAFTSDRNTKDRITPVDTQSTLEKVSRLPLAQWSYKGYEQRHIGPMAQDWHALFPLNNDDKMINELDVQGVALAAIQGLNQKLQERDSEIQKLHRQNEALENRLEALEQKIKAITKNK